MPDRSIAWLRHPRLNVNFQYANGDTCLMLVMRIKNVDARRAAIPRVCARQDLQLAIENDDGNTALNIAGSAASLLLSCMGLGHLFHQPQPILWPHQPPFLYWHHTLHQYTGRDMRAIVYTLLCYAQRQYRTRLTRSCGQVLPALSTDVWYHIFSFMQVDIWSS